MAAVTSEGPVEEQLGDPDGVNIGHAEGGVTQVSVLGTSLMGGGVTTGEEACLLERRRLCLNAAIEMGTWNKSPCAPVGQLGHDPGSRIQDPQKADAAQDEQ